MVWLSAAASLIRAAPFLDPAALLYAEISGDESAESGSSALTPLSSKWESLAQLLVSDVSKLQKQQDDEVFQASIERLQTFGSNHLTMPRIKQEHGCFKTGFNKERCLHTVATGLQEYSIYMEYVDEVYPLKSEVQHVKYRTRTLTDVVMKSMKNPLSVEELDSERKELLLGVLPTESKWERNTAVHFILKEFHHFVQDTFRAIRHMKCQNTRAKDCE
ncbi:interleukin-6 [Amia ocellicauda]|uniref:interleukin-6 n=1 Tax=Amia ocellicauda TaxID=2972642 RepID=UPI003463A602